MRAGAAPKEPPLKPFVLLTWSFLMVLGSGRIQSRI